MPPGSPLTPLVLRCGGFGDMVMTVPMLKALARRWGRPCDLLSSGPWTAPLVSRVPEAGQLILLGSRRTPYLLDRSQREFVRWLRQRPPGPVYVAEGNDKFHWLLRQGGVAPEWVCSLKDHPAQPGEHTQVYQLRLAAMTPSALAGADAPVAATPPDSRPVLTAADTSDAEAWLARNGLAGAPLVLFQPGNKKTMRRGLRRRASNVKWWPEERWAQVLAGVRQTLPAARLLICGSPGERELADAIARRSALPGVFVATDELPIPRLLALQARAHSMISIDTGPAHSAAAMGCPVVVLFARWHARILSVPISTGAPVLALGPESADDDAGMLSIGAEAVLAAWRRLPAISDSAAAG